MRPLRLEMVGFSAFRKRTTVDFTDVDLAAFWGPTGSGKSTIVDAITFALYGSVARYDDNRLVAPIVNQLCTEARVRLDFEVGDEAYSAVRVVRRTDKGATTKGAQLERGLEVLAGSAREMDPAVERLLGMDFDQFIKTVVLPQGAFATFLHDRPADRQKLLRQLLDLGIYTRMGEEARRRSATARTKIETLTEQLDKGEDVTDEHLAALDERVKDLTKLRRTLETEIGELAALTAEVEELSEADACRERELQSLALLVVPDAVASLGEALQEATEELAGASAADAGARAAQTEAERAVEDGPDAEVCRRLLEAFAERESGERDVEALKGSVAAAATAFEESDREAVEARAALDGADAQLHAARLKAGAAGLRPVLVVGEPCPVCEQVVAEVPAHDVDVEVAAVEERRRQAHAASRKCDEARVRALETHAEAKANLAAAGDRLVVLDEKLTGAPTVDRLEADLEKASSLAEASGEAARLAEVARVAEDAARSAVEGLMETERALRRDYSESRDAVAPLAPPRPAGESLHDDWAELADWALTKGTEIEQARATSAEILDEKSVQRDTKRQAILDLCLPYLEGEVPENLVEHFTEAATRAAAALEHARKRREELDAMRSQVGDLEVEGRVAGELGQLLKANGFERWLMEEAIVDLVDRATDRLLELSGGQYSLVAHETDFRIKDHRNADEVRDARTLSGGETFLASLSLALALADSIAELAPEGSPQLDSIFLDEGFGTLDPETLDVVASAIEELGAAGRMVGIVTHIRELADRMPVRFEVAKGPTSSTVDRVEV